MDIGIVPQNVLCTVPVVYIEIDDSDTCQPVGGGRMFCGKGNCRIQAKPHGFVAFRMMTGRTHSNESAVGVTRHDEINRGTGSANGMRGSF